MLYSVSADIIKCYLCKFETREIKRVILEVHVSVHININNLNKQASSNYIGIVFTSIKSLVRTVLIVNENRRPAHCSFFSIINSFVRECLIVDNIDLAKYAE
ncbi:hypothetical protein CDIK_1186 [Cucumispora dikerogammari]|nr:hypothetical protein CDIK_1186 [Cucumispora dikerogammari]